MKFAIYFSRNLMIILIFIPIILILLYSIFYQRQILAFENMGNVEVHNNDDYNSATK